MQKTLLEWFEENQRPLPWRGKKADPYKVLVSETMLQQTTVALVIPYYHRFMKRFPTLTSLAQAHEAEVCEHWAGLGYYSRARNLLKTAKVLLKLKGFPRSHSELIQLPGLGPYTSRAISSIAFKEAVGVLDGNVIRVLCRLYNLDIPWWQSSDRRALQELADQAVQGVDSSYMNQALMELGSVVCRSQSPSCLICPLLKDCQSQKMGREGELPLKRPKRKREVWVWRPLLYKRQDKIGFIINDYTPFLKGQWLLPGSISQQSKKPNLYDFRHSITHHDIYVQVQKVHEKGTYKNKEARAQLKELRQMSIKWLRVQEVARWAPFSLIRKVLRHDRPSKEMAAEMNI